MDIDNHDLQPPHPPQLVVVTPHTLPIDISIADV